MPIIRMPDNTQVQFPDDMPPEQIKGIIASKFPRETQAVPTSDFIKTQKPSLWDDFATGGGNIITERGLGIIQLLDEAAGGSILSPKAREASYKASKNLAKERENLGSAGTVANIVADPLMLLPMAKGLQGAKALAATGAVAGGLAGALTSSQTPEDDKLARAGLGTAIGSVAAPVMGKALDITGDILGKAGKKLTSKAGTQLANKKADFVQDLVLPLSDKGRSLRSSESGVFNTIKYTPTTREIEVADAVNKITRITPKRSEQYNLNVINDEIGNLANKLQNQLKSSKVIFPKKEYTARVINNLQDIIDNHPVLVGDAAATANRLLPEIKKVIDKHPSTPAGLLAARKEIDKTLESFKPNFFEAKADNAFNIIGNRIRQTTNDFIAEKAPSVKVKNLLKNQNLLYEARDNIIPKADKLAKNSINRLFQKVGNIVPLKAEIAGIAALGGIGTLISPAAALTAGGVYGAGKIANAAATKKALGELLKATSKAINITKDRAIIAELVSDRNNLIDYIKSLNNKEAVNDIAK